MSNQTQLQRRPKFWGESEYYLDLENEDKKWYKEKSTLSNGEHLPDPNVSISLLWFVSKVDFVISSYLLIWIQHCVTPCW